MQSPPVLQSGGFRHGTGGVPTRVDRIPQFTGCSPDHGALGDRHSFRGCLRILLRHEDRGQYCPELAKRKLSDMPWLKGESNGPLRSLIYRNDARMHQQMKTLKPEEVVPEKREWVTDGRPYVLTFDHGTCEVRVMGEAGKVNINLVSEPVLRKIINQFGLEGEERDVVVDSILDWRTPGELHRLNGAKSDYYQSLKEPYDCKNGSLDSIEELLLVRGVTPELFYGMKKTGKGDEGGRVDRAGLKDIFSIYASGEQIDINSASATTLRIVLGIPNEVAQQIVNAREDKDYENPTELLRRVPELSTFMATAGGLIVFQSQSPYYTIESRAKNRDGGTGSRGQGDRQNRPARKNKI